MLFCTGLTTLVLVLATSSVESVLKPCWCSAVPPAALQVNCSSLGLMEVPPISPDTTELQLQNNQLSRVPRGHFDRLQSLRSVTLSGNPFHCDCGIQYLRAWLRRNRAVVSGAMPTCSSPSSVALTSIAALSDDYFSSCGQRGCAEEKFAILVGLMLCVVICLLLWGLRLAKKSTFTLDINKRHKAFHLESLRSLKPKHRSGVKRDLSEDSDYSAPLTRTDRPVRPLINLEILPQILGVLQKKHNMKMKAT
ncbi:hypothetical protein UPYG_G00013980 [Umbra pygmaea]|uniref:LRRCT domain-containing protein n=1 Tax=Umbra pygmaea TaxID=75934 RepID=A0ABD0XLK3_UMBPY